MSSIFPKKSDIMPRAPVVVVMGHVDHGKTSILDFIRKTKIVEGEAGGITQHIGAYQIEVPLKEEPKSRQSEVNRGILRSSQDDFAARKITFIDTPGHEAFNAMRGRGAKVADIAILVVAADEGVKPQTKEAWQHIKSAGLKAIIALNKIDRPRANTAKVKQELKDLGILIEEFGGEIPAQSVSAKTGQGIADLLDLINLIAEMEKLSADFAAPAKGIVIESFLDAQAGPTATILLKEGVLKIKDIILTSTTMASIKCLKDSNLKEISQGLPSQPLIITGFEDVPLVGDKFEKIPDSQTAREKLEKKMRQKGIKHPASSVIEIKEGQKALNLILKADVLGSLEAIEKSLAAIIDEKVILRLLKKEVGLVSEKDLKLAQSARAQIFVFRAKIPKEIEYLAQKMKIRIKAFEIIYELIQTVREEITKQTPSFVVKEAVGRAKIIALFIREKNRQIIGGKVISGKIERNCQIDVFRDKEKIGSGRLKHLQRNKKEVQEVILSQEAGIEFIGEIEIEKGDVLEFFKEGKKDVLAA